MSLPSEYRETFRVRSSDTDAGNRWKLHEMHCLLQETAKNHAEELGLGYEQMYRRGQAWVLARMRIRLEKMPLMGAVVQVLTWPKGIQQRIFWMRDYLLTAGEMTVARVSSAWLIIDLNTRRMLLPERLRLDFPISPRDALEGEVEKPLIAEGLPSLGSRTVSYSEVDTMGHLNSARYLAWITDVLPEEILFEQRLREVLLNYSSELRSGEVCTLTGAPNDTQTIWQIRGEERQSGKRVFEALVRVDPPGAVHSSG